MTDPTDGRTRWNALEQWSPTAFLVAGVLLLFTAVVYALELVASVALEGLLTGLPLFAGLLVAYTGLLGLYPLLAERAPRLTLAALVLVVVPVLVVVFFLVFAVASLFVELREPSFAGLLFMATFVGFAFGTILFSIASLRTRTPSRTVGFFLLVFAVPWVVLLGAGADPPTWLEFGTTVTMAVAVLVIGSRLRAEAGPTDHTEPTPTEARND